jgi:hypothetical protein
MSEANKFTSLNRITRKLTSVSTVTISNTAAISIDAPMRLVVKNLTATAVMPEASGTTPAGDFYYDLGAKLDLTALAPGQSASIQIKFVYPSTSRLTYGLEFWGTTP